MKGEYLTRIEQHKVYFPSFARRIQEFLRLKKCDKHPEVCVACVAKDYPYRLDNPNDPEFVRRVCRGNFENCHWFLVAADTSIDYVAD
jgi:hypothetical protein